MSADVKRSRSTRPVCDQGVLAAAVAQQRVRRLVELAAVDLGDEPPAVVEPPAQVAAAEEPSARRPDLDLQLVRRRRPRRRTAAARTSRAATRRDDRRGPIQLATMAGTAAGRASGLSTADSPAIAGRAGPRWSTSSSTATALSRGSSGSAWTSAGTRPATIPAPNRVDCDGRRTGGHGYRPATVRTLPPGSATSGHDVERQARDAEQRQRARPDGDRAGTEREHPEPRGPSTSVVGVAATVALRRHVEDTAQSTRSHVAVADEPPIAESIRHALRRTGPPRRAPPADGRVSSNDRGGRLHGTHSAMRPRSTHPSGERAARSVHSLRDLPRLWTAHRPGADATT